MTHEQIVQVREKLSGILVDTNLFLLFLTGIYDKSQIPKFNRIDKYSEEDFETLLGIVDSFGGSIYITPHILTEVCDLTSKFNRQKNNEIFKLIERLVLNYKEENIPSIDLINKDQTAFYKFGLADSSIINLAKQNILILTDDASLYHMIISKGFFAVNFTRLMSFNE